MSHINARSTSDLLLVQKRSEGMLHKTKQKTKHYCNMLWSDTSAVQSQTHHYLQHTMVTEQIEQIIILRQTVALIKFQMWMERLYR